jgi:hypothetical protein
MGEFKSGDRVRIVKDYCEYYRLSDRDGILATFGHYVDNANYPYSVIPSDWPENYEILVHSIVHDKQVVRENKLKELLDVE